MSEVNSLIKVGISSCLLGQKVRFDAGHKKNSYITSVLSDYFEFLPFCPEVEIGLGIPRETIRLVSLGSEIQCVGTKTPELNVTDKLRAIAEQQKDWQAELCGYILKRDSPSCGMERVRVYNDKNMPEKIGIGLYAQKLMENFPELPVEEEGRLEDKHLRENFISRVIIYSRWKAMVEKSLTISDIQNFHATHKYILMSHHQNSTRELGQLLANHDNLPITKIAEIYLQKMMQLLKVIASRSNHVNTLKHIQGYLKKQLESEDKQELNELIENYRQGLVPLVVPITLLRYFFKKHQNEYIANSYYMAPHPAELMLLNQI